MKFDKRYLIPGFLIVAAILWLYFNGKKQAPAPATPSQPDTTPAAQQYPSAGSVVPGIDPKPIAVGGSPFYMTYNVPPSPYDSEADVGGTNGCACENACGQGSLANSIKIPDGFFDTAKSNLDTVGQQVISKPVTEHWLAAK